MSLPSEFEKPARCPSPQNFPSDDQLPKAFAEYYLAYARPLSIASDPFHLMAMLSCLSAVIGPRCHVRYGNLCIYPSIGPLQARGDRGTEIGVSVPCRYHLPWGLSCFPWRYQDRRCIRSHCGRGPVPTYFGTLDGTEPQSPLRSLLLPSHGLRARHKQATLRPASRNQSLALPRFALVTRSHLPEYLGCDMGEIGTQVLDPRHAMLHACCRFVREATVALDPLHT